jgi:L-serine dehydratase
MESIRELYRIGHGPSSSHTMGPRRAAEEFLKKEPAAPSYRVTLFGSLAATGKGHLTFQTLKEVFAGRTFDIAAKPNVLLPRHPNALTFEALGEDGAPRASWTAYSVGGGKIVDDSPALDPPQIYPFGGMDAILADCESQGRPLWAIVTAYEDAAIFDFLAEVWRIMQEAVRRGLKTDGTLPGVLKLPRKAHSYAMKAKTYGGSARRLALLFAYALAVSEENASGGLIVTAPTCGACGVLPAVLYYLKQEYRFADGDILKALAAAGLIGTVVKTNASISGAELGCQAEVGVACAMAGAAAAQLYGGTAAQIEYAAEMGIEHHLGLTCDPVAGLVQIPCIERNAMAAARALDHQVFALLSDGRHRISFDEVIEAMKQTGRDLSPKYRETSKGGLAIVEKVPEY